MDTAAIDREIAELERRAETLNEDVFKFGPATPKGREANDAYNLVTERLAELRRQRVGILAGVPVADNTAAARAPVRTARMPHRITAKADSAGRKKPAVDRPLPEVLQDELQQLFNKYIDADAIEHIEDLVQDITLSVDAAKPPHKTTTKTIRTERDKDGNLVAHVSETAANEFGGSGGGSKERMFTQGLYTGLISTIARLSAELHAVAEFQMIRRNEIQARLDALEQRPVLKFCGIFSKDKKYCPGEFVSKGGSLWHANVETTGVEPGGCPEIWQLAVKRGREDERFHRDLTAAQARIAELEQHQLKFLGVWKEGTSYGTNTIIADHGSIWFCKSPTCDRPGTSDAWQLMAKRGVPR